MLIVPLYFTFVSLFRELVDRSAKRLEESFLLFLLSPKGHALSPADEKQSNMTLLPKSLIQGHFSWASPAAH